MGFVNLLWYNGAMEEHTHHGWQTNEVPRPSTDQLFNDAWFWAKDKGAQPIPTMLSLNEWMGKLNREVNHAPFNRDRMFDTIGTCMCGLIALCESLNINPNSCLDVAFNHKDFSIDPLPKTHQTLDAKSPKPDVEPLWMKKLRWELQARFIGLFVWYPDEQCWVRLDHVEIDYRNSPEGRRMDRIQDHYGNMHFVAELIEREKDRQVKAFNDCPSDKLVY